MHNPGSGVLAGIGRVFGRVFTERYCCYWAPSRPCGAAGLLLWLPGRISPASRVLPLHPTRPPPYSSTLRPVLLAPLTTMRTTGRHDDPEEKRQDAIRAGITASTALRRRGVKISLNGTSTGTTTCGILRDNRQWARSYLHSGLVLTPELHLRRPPA
ncbi:hypothetical protein B0H16DRAFT_1566396 [Mycena metata]|uniref:Uncharacterized protein n=1 Tax=Mycena metata TaxID=1033252 RepID=A0AAD7IDU6_9AGAR|nr:hypothetical protein B0H16DRAFT_1566396 [Mycena metata]